MQRRDISKVLLATAAGYTGGAQEARAQSCTAPCYAQTAAESAAGVTPVNTAYSPGDLLRYGTNTTPGTTDMTNAFINMWTQAAQPTGADCYVPPGTYLHNNSFGDYPAGVTTRGGGRDVTHITKGFNGNTFSSIGAYAKLQDLWFDGNATSGNWATYPTGSRSQIVRDCQISNFMAGSSHGVVDFADTTAGSQCIFDAVEIWQTSGTTGSGLYAFVIQDTTQLAAYPRHFCKIETQGFCAFSFGGANDLYIDSSTLGDLLYSSNTRGVHICATRILNQASLTINGHNNTITGCDINPQITLASGTDANAIKGNSYNILPVIDDSGNARNDVDFWEIAFTPTLVAGGTVSNGSLIGAYSRSGAMIAFDINYQVGSMDSLSGELEFGLPVPRVSGTISQPGVAILTHSATQYNAAVQIPGNVGFCTLIYNITGSAPSSPTTAAPVTATVPATWSSGDTIRFSGVYNL